MLFIQFSRKSLDYSRLFFPFNEKSEVFSVPLRQFVRLLLSPWNHHYCWGCRSIIDMLVYFWCSRYSPNENQHHHSRTRNVTIRVGCIKEESYTRPRTTITYEGVFEGSTWESLGCWNGSKQFNVLVVYRLLKGGFIGSRLRCCSKKWRKNTILLPFSHRCCTDGAVKDSFHRFI